MKRPRLLPLLGAALVAASTAHAQAPRPAPALALDEPTPAAAPQPAPITSGLRTSSLQLASGMQASAGLGLRGALPARAARTDDDLWRLLFPFKKAKQQ
jgi:hypothetical protein